MHSLELCLFLALLWEDFLHETEIWYGFLQAHDLVSSGRHALTSVKGSEPEGQFSWEDVLSVTRSEGMHLEVPPVGFHLPPSQPQ